MDRIPISLISNIITKYFSIDQKMKLKTISKEFNQNIKLIYNYADIYFIYNCTDYKYKVFFFEKIRKKEMYLSLLDKNNFDCAELNNYKDYIINMFNILKLKERKNDGLLNFDLKLLKPNNFLLINKREYNIHMGNIFLVYNDFIKFSLDFKKKEHLSTIKKKLKYEFNFKLNKKDIDFIKNIIRQDFKSLFSYKKYKLKFYHNKSYDSKLSFKLNLILKKLKNFNPN
jgi:hypothetical protein